MANGILSARLVPKHTTYLTAAPPRPSREATQRTAAKPTMVAAAKPPTRAAPHGEQNRPGTGHGHGPRSHLCPLPAAAACRAGLPLPPHLQSFRADLLPTEKVSLFESKIPCVLAPAPANPNQLLILAGPFLCSDRGQTFPFSTPWELFLGLGGGGHRHPLLFLGTLPSPLRTEDWEDLLLPRGLMLRSQIQSRAPHSPPCPGLVFTGTLLAELRNKPGRSGKVLLQRPAWSHGLLWPSGRPASAAKRSSARLSSAPSGEQLSGRGGHGDPPAEPGEEKPQQVVALRGNLWLSRFTSRPTNKPGTKGGREAPAAPSAASRCRGLRTRRSAGALEVLPRPSLGCQNLALACEQIPPPRG